MKKQRTGHRVGAAKTGAVGPTKRPLTTALLIGALTLACAVVSAIWLAPVPKAARADAAARSAAPAEGSAWKVGMLRPDGLRIIVTGSDDASKVLDAEQFSRSDVRHGYWVAAQIPAVLNKLYCWCGCENRGVHRSNLQCFEDGMAEDCEVCLGTAEIAYDMTSKGITDAAQIQAAVDVHWGAEPMSAWIAWRRLVWLCLAASTGVLAQPGAAGRSPVPQATAVPAATGALERVRSWLKGDTGQPELLPPDQAFQIAARAKDATSLSVELTPARDYYLYRDRISFSVVAPAGVSVAGVALPPGEPKADPTFGTVQVYHRPFEATVTLHQTADPADRIELRASYQGCNEPLGVCYPPIEKTVTVAMSSTVGATASPSTAAAQSAAAPATDGSDAHAVRQLFAHGGRWAVVAAFFGFGLLLAFTPCMLPMIPILSGIIVGHGQRLTRRHAIGLSAVYVLAMAVTYALAGVAAGLAGTLLSAYLQNPWVLGSFAAIFVLLALSMFGLYELQLPATLQSRLAAASGRIRGGKAIGAFLMGVLSALIVGPCVAAPLAGALLYIGQTHDVVLGGTALFAMAIGMGVPLLVVGATAGSLLPKAGPWTEAIKRVFGVTMLAMAVYTVSPVIPVVAQQLLWAALLIVPAIYLHALDPLPADAPGHRRLFKGVGVLSLLVGAAMLLGALSGHREILQPLAGLRGGERTERRELAFQPVTSVADLDARLRAARGRPVMLDFWAEWCVSCKEMDQFTFSDTRVQSRLKESLLLRADVTANNADDQALLRRFGLFGPPGIVFFDRGGREVAFRVIGFQPPEQFLASLDRADPPRAAPY